MLPSKPEQLSFKLRRKSRKPALKHIASKFPTAANSSYDGNNAVLPASSQQSTNSVSNSVNSTSGSQTCCSTASFMFSPVSTRSEPSVVTIPFASQQSTSSVSGGSVSSTAVSQTYYSAPNFTFFPSLGASPESSLGTPAPLSQFSSSSVAGLPSSAPLASVYASPANIFGVSSNSALPNITAPFPPATAYPYFTQLTQPLQISGSTSAFSPFLFPITFPSCSASLSVPSSFFPASSTSNISSCLTNPFLSNTTISPFSFSPSSATLLPTATAAATSFPLVAPFYDPNTQLTFGQGLSSSSTSEQERGCSCCAKSANAAKEARGQIREMQKKVDYFEKEANQLREKAAQLQREADQRQKEVDRLQEEANQLRGEATRLQREADQRQEDAKRLQNENVQLIRQKDALTASISSLQKIIKQISDILPKETDMSSMSSTDARPQFTLSPISIHGTRSIFGENPVQFQSFFSSDFFAPSPPSASSSSNSGSNITPEPIPNSSLSCSSFYSGSSQ